MRHSENCVKSYCRVTADHSSVKLRTHAISKTSVFTCNVAGLMAYLQRFSVLFIIYIQPASYISLTEREHGSNRVVESCYVVKECKRDSENLLLSYHFSGV